MASAQEITDCQAGGNKLCRYKYSKPTDLWEYPTGSGANQQTKVQKLQQLATAIITWNNHGTQT